MGIPRSARPRPVLAGIGTGWQENEFRALGAGDRFHRRGSATAEFIDILRTCWNDPSRGFTGEFYSFGPLHFEPRPATGIPILLAGSSARGLHRVATHGDGFHGTNLSPAAASEAIAQIERYAETHGRQSGPRLFTTLCELDLRDQIGPNRTTAGSTSSAAPNRLPSGSLHSPMRGHSHSAASSCVVGQHP